MSDRPQLKTERLLLRPFRLEDVDDVYAYARDPEWGRYLAAALPRPYERKHAEEFVARQVLTSWATTPTFAIALNSTVIGSIALRVDEANQTANLSYALAMVHWGNGLIPEATKAAGLGVYGVRAGQGLCHRRPPQQKVLEGDGESRHDS